MTEIVIDLSVHKFMEHFKDIKMAQMVSSTPTFNLCFIAYNIAGLGLPS